MIKFMQRLGFLILSIISMNTSAQVDCNNVSQTGVQKAECQALVHLYHSTNGPNWKESCKTNWLSEASVNSWEGVDVFQGRVSAVKLYSCDLKGIIPESIQHLSKTKIIDFGRNQLSGPIPSGIGNLTGLMVLSLERNKLSGSIPKSFVHLEKLQFAILYDNYLRGTISNSLFNSNLSNVKMYFGENCFNPLSANAYMEIVLNPIFLPSGQFAFYNQRPAHECRIRSLPVHNE